VYKVPTSAEGLKLLYVAAEVLLRENATEPGLREAVVAALVNMHNSAKDMTIRLGRQNGRQHYLSPR
jgi:hypothetical protein